MKGKTCTIIFISLIVIDYFLGSGILDMFQKLFSKVNGLLKTSLQEEAKNIHINVGVENPISLPLLLMEIFLLSLTLAFFKRFKRLRGVDRINELLNQSKEEINNANEILEKWRLRKINWQMPNDCPYLDDEPQVIQPLKLEVPILHMAIIDTLGSRSQPKRADAGDAVNDSTLLSITSLLDEDFESNVENRSSEENIDKKFDYNNRFLWDVIEEDTSVERE